MIFSKKEITVAYAVEGCDSCEKSTKRKYRRGDTVFARAGPCSCGGDFYIERIYGEIVRQ